MTHVYFWWKSWTRIIHFKLEHLWDWKYDYLKVPSICCSWLIRSPKSGVTILRNPKPNNMYAYRIPTPLRPVSSFILQVNLQTRDKTGQWLRSYPAMDTQDKQLLNTYHKISTVGLTIPVTSPDKSVVNFSRSWVILWSASTFSRDNWKTYKASM